MIIVVINNMGITVNKLKKYSPIAGYSHRIKALFAAAQLVSERTRIPG